MLSGFYFIVILDVNWALQIQDCITIKKELQQIPTKPNKYV